MNSTELEEMFKRFERGNTVTGFTVVFLTGLVWWLKIQPQVYTALPLQLQRYG